MKSSIFYTFSKEQRFNDLETAISHCDLCPRLCSRTKVFSKNNGNIHSKVIFIAEAPGRLGADKTGIPLYGDKTGQNFDLLLSNISWNRESIFITNALLCNPRNEDGNNSTPTIEEIENCSSYLEMTLNLIEPDVIVTLGAVALSALSIISPHSLKLKENVANPFEWNGYIVFPLYHPGPRAVLHRPIAKQRADFIVLSKLVSPQKGLINRKPRVTKSLKPVITCLEPIQQTILMILSELGEVSYFKLTKLLYLIDLNAIQKLGKSITGEIYLRQQEGPWSPVLGDNVNALRNQKLISTKIIVKLNTDVLPELSLEEDSINLIREVTKKYGAMNEFMIKVAAYRSKPMRYILDQEKKGKNMLKVPVIYKDKTVIDLDVEQN
jgi:uracil-DNA glycosylase family 4